MSTRGLGARASSGFSGSRAVYTPRMPVSLALVASILVLASPPSKADKPKGIAGESDPCEVIRVIDGDTVDVKIGEGTDRLRLLDIDTEESHNSPAKKITPFGLETAAWAKDYLDAGMACWVEYGPERRDVYDRLLAYLWVKRDGAWEDYNLTTVKLGKAPYFTKYGYSQWHHAEFAAAQKAAQEKHLGVWDPAEEGNLRGAYLGPDGLIPWWNDRADALARYEKEARTRPDIFDTRLHWDLIKRKAPATMTVFTAIRDRDPKAAGFVGRAEGKLFQKFHIVAAGGNAAIERALEASTGRYRYFVGKVDLLEDGRTLQMTIADAADIRLDPPPFARKAPAAATPAPSSGTTGGRARGKTRTRPAGR